MNIEGYPASRPAAEHRPSRADSPLRPLLGFLLLLLLLVLWWFLTIPKQPTAGSGGGTGTGSAPSGEGAGSGDHGNGPGSGERGAGPGSGQQGDGTGAGKQGDGTGSTAPAPGDAGQGAGGAQTGDASRNDGGEAAAAAAPPQEEAKPQPVVHAFRSDPPPKARSGGDRRESGRTGVSGSSGYRGFYGLKVSTQAKVLFLVDTSGSMAGPRIATLKQELKKALGLDRSGKRPSAGSFIIIGFNSDTIKFPAEGMAHYGNKQEMAKAEEFIDIGLHAGGGTAMTPAWQEALQEAKTHQISAIYFLTDGEGELTTGSLLALIDQAGLPKLAVSCIAIGHDQSYMREVAKKRGGKYVYFP